MNIDILIIVIIAILLILSFAILILRTNGGIKKQLNYSGRTHDIENVNSHLRHKIRECFVNEACVDMAFTVFSIWNSGCKVIDGNDIAGKIRVTSLSEDIKILDCDILRHPNQSNNFRIDNINYGCIEMNFDYLNPGDEAIIKVFHTGKENRKNLAIECEIKDGKKLKGNDGVFKKNQDRVSRCFSYIGVFLGVVSGILIGIMLFLHPAIESGNIAELKYIKTSFSITLLVGLSILILGFTILKINEKRCQKFREYIKEDEGAMD